MSKLNDSDKVSDHNDSNPEVEENPEDIFNILVATDIHLGYGETDPIRGESNYFVSLCLYV